MVTNLGEPSKSGFHYLRITLPLAGEFHRVSPCVSPMDLAAEERRAGLIRGLRGTDGGDDGVYFILKL